VVGDHGPAALSLDDRHVCAEELIVEEINLSGYEIVQRRTLEEERADRLTVRRGRHHREIGPLRTADQPPKIGDDRLVGAPVDLERQPGIRCQPAGRPPEAVAITPPAASAASSPTKPGQPKPAPLPIFLGALCGLDCRACAVCRVRPRLCQRACLCIGLSWRSLTTRFGRG
jgi:hypothetical protein